MDYKTQVSVMRTLQQQRGMVPTFIEDVPNVLRKMADDSKAISSRMVNTTGKLRIVSPRGQAMQANEVLLYALADNIDQALADQREAHAAVQVEGSDVNPETDGRSEPWVTLTDGERGVLIAWGDPEQQRLAERRQTDRRKYDRRGLPAGRDGDQLYGRRASDPR